MWLPRAWGRPLKVAGVVALTDWPPIPLDPQTRPRYGPPALWLDSQTAARRGWVGPSPQAGCRRNATLCSGERTLMGKKPMLGLAGALLTSMALAGCQNNPSSPPRAFAPASAGVGQTTQNTNKNTGAQVTNNGLTTGGGSTNPALSPPGGGPYIPANPMPANPNVGNAGGVGAQSFGGPQNPYTPAAGVQPITPPVGPNSASFGSSAPTQPVSGAPLGAPYLNGSSVQPTSRTTQPPMPPVNQTQFGNTAP
jgi:hypothetical protein